MVLFSGKEKMIEIMNERRTPTKEELERSIDRHSEKYALVFAALAGDPEAIEEMKKEINPLPVPSLNYSANPSTLDSLTCLYKPLCLNESPESPFTKISYDGSSDCSKVPY